jgi:hypothetical protein
MRRALALLLLAPSAADAATTAPVSLPPAAASVAAPAPPPPVPQSPLLVGPTGKTLTLTPDVLAGLERESATMVNHGASHAYEGVVLTELLRLVDAPTGARVHAAAVRDYLVVTGADGFRAVLSLAETDASVQAHPVILADKMDGAPLIPHDAPFRVVVDGDRKPSRSVYAVTRIEVKVLP